VDPLPVAWDDISSAFAFVSFDGGGNSAYVCRRTGAVYWHAEFGDNLEELPEDIETGDYLALPGPRDLDLGSRLVMRFADDVLPDHADAIAKIFSRKGAYGRFKDVLVEIGARDRWYEYEAAATEKALREWCADNGLEVEG
jgi:hypothetical protein